MADKYLVEAFQKLDILDEDTFDITGDEVKKLSDFVSDDEMEEVQPIVDPLAQSDEELQDSYIGKVILDCTVCQTKIYKDASDVVVSEDGTLANVGEECPYCHTSDGYKIIGEVAPYSKTDIDVEVTTKDGEEQANIDLTSKEDDDEKDELDEACKTKKGVDKLKSLKKEGIKEDLNGITIDTDKETINVTATEKAEDGEEMIAPITDETKEEIKSEGEEDLKDVGEPEYQDFDIDEFDESQFDDLGESYMKKVYENVASYKTVKGSVKGNLLKLEGIITFKSGKKAKTNFVFEASTTTKTGKVKFLGENKQFARGRKSFTLTGKVKGNKLIAESLTYNYRAKDAKSGSSKRLYGTIRK